MEHGLDFLFLAFGGLLDVKSLQKSRKRLCSVSLISIHKQEKLITVQLFYVNVVVTAHLTRSSNYPSIFAKATMRRNCLLPCVKTDVATKRAF